MLSIIVYGRNDSHGYNLARRAVLSLNCLAELLDDPDDEILFVDYNTSNDLPSFIEANRDTLTDRARRRLRVLRVRPDQHARFVDRTHLPVLEGIARNVAIRRSNPANRWILSTNSDIIVTPRNGMGSLSAFVASLPDGFHHAPRYELPQIIWESLDRMDPVAAIARVAELGSRLHLDEIVRTFPSHGVDSPGDFQLVLRRDMIALRGFDENMLLGWHLDANLARRLSFLYGSARLVESDLAVYHCDHTRQATLTHQAGHLENDWVRFVDDVSAAAVDLPEQADNWGLADETVEEIWVGGDPLAAYLAALSDSPPPRRHEYLKVPETFNDLTYAPEHVLPYLLDLMSALPRGQATGYHGCRPDMEELVRGGLAALGFTGGFLTGDDAIERADILIFEFGLATASGAVEEGRDGRDWRDADLERLCSVREAFTAFAVMERSRPGAARRRAILINAVHNVFEAGIAADLSSVHTPFSTRLRQGFIRDDIAIHRPLPATGGGALAVTNREGASSRLPSLADWEDPQWAAALRRGFGRDALDVAPRNLWFWERGGILYALEEMGALRGDARILVAATMPEPLYAALTTMVGEVIVADWRRDPIVGGGEEEAWRCPVPLLRPSRLHFRCEDVSGAANEEAAFDAVVLPHNVMLRDGPLGMVHALAWARWRLRPGGAVVFTAAVRVSDQVGGTPTDNAMANGPAAPVTWLEAADLNDGRLAGALALHAGLTLVNPPNVTLITTTADDLASDDGDDRDGALIIRRGDGLFTAMTGVLRLSLAMDGAMDRATEGDAIDWIGLATALDHTMLGPQLGRLTATGGIQRDGDGGVIISRDQPPGHVLFGPYSPLLPGDYRLTVVAFAAGDLDAPAFDLRVRRSDGVVLAERVALVGPLARSPLVVRFHVPISPPGIMPPTVEFQFAHFAAADTRIAAVDLEMTDAAASGLWRDGWIDSFLGPLLPRLNAAEGAHAVAGGDGVTIATGASPGHMLYGPYLGLPAGPYCLAFAATPDDDVPDDETPCEVMVVAASDDGDLVMAKLPLSAGRLRAGPASLRFDVPPDHGVEGISPRPVEIRVTRLTTAGLTVRVVDARREVPGVLWGHDPRLLEPTLGALLPRLSRTGVRAAVAAEDDGDGISVTLDDPPGCLLYGPYLHLPAGDYQLRVAVRCKAPVQPVRPTIEIEAVAGDVVLATRRMNAFDLSAGDAVLAFSLPSESAFDGTEAATVEIRVGHFANAALTITAVDLHSAEVYPDHGSRR